MQTPAALRIAIHLFSYSRFLSDAMLREPERILQLSNSRTFDRVLTVEDYREKLYSFPRRRASRRRWISRASAAATSCASCCATCWARPRSPTSPKSSRTSPTRSSTSPTAAFARELVARHGEPRLEDGSLCGFSVISLGKLGGKELNYSSDIDLMFVYGGAGETDGPGVLTNKEFYKKVANQYTALLSTYTAEGQCYRVDLRLRPDGTLGEVAISEEGALAYYSERARDWEKQMLIKARISAGESEPGAALLEFVEPLIYQSSLDFRAVEAVSETRQRISEKLAAQARRARRARRQAHARRHPRYRVPGAVPAAPARRPRAVGAPRRHHVRALPPARQGPSLRHASTRAWPSAYQFLRYLEHRLQVEEDRQTHTLPTDRQAPRRAGPQDAARHPQMATS